MHDQRKLKYHGFDMVYLLVNFEIIMSKPNKIEAAQAKKRNDIHGLYQIKKTPSIRSGLSTL